MATLSQLRTWFGENTICGMDRKVSLAEMKELTAADRTELLDMLDNLSE